jgi:MYXO-CTERM domain-containing protein
LCSTCQDPLASAGGGWSLFLLGGAGSLLLRRRARRVSGFFCFLSNFGFCGGFRV